jgi:predicted nucleic acid-binding protein
MASRPYQRAYLDADVWTSALAGEPGRAEVVRPILEAADAAEIRLLVSALMPLEVLGGPSQSRTQDQEEAAEAIVTRSSNIVVPAGRTVVLQARRYRLEHKLRAMDALHLASAVRGRAEVFFTWNMGDFGRVAPRSTGCGSASRTGGARRPSRGSAFRPRHGGMLDRIMTLA